MPGRSRATTKTEIFLWGTLLLYAVARLLQLYSALIPPLAIVCLHVIPPAVFALFHGSRTYRLQGGLAFVALSLGVGTASESLSLGTGFPFGHYYFTQVMGPKVFELPVLLALAYVGMGYLAWILALLIAGQAEKRLSGPRLLTLPLLASFIMTAWDLSMEPVWSTIDKAWVWRNGGPYFGVPISNFLGWYLTTYIFYQLFALYLGGREPLPHPRGHWIPPILFYALSACGNLLLVIPAATAVRIDPVVFDPSGRDWRASGILGACVLVSLFVMLPFTLLAWARLSPRPVVPLGR
jgi:hypothetical protein